MQHVDSSSGTIGPARDAAPLRRHLSGTTRFQFDCGNSCRLNFSLCLLLSIHRQPMRTSFMANNIIMLLYSRPVIVLAPYYYYALLLMGNYCWPPLLLLPAINNYCSLLPLLLLLPTIIARCYCWRTALAPNLPPYSAVTVIDPFIPPPFSPELTPVAVLK
jgi:hypothetical protein